MNDEADEEQDDAMRDERGIIVIMGLKDDAMGSVLESTTLDGVELLA